MAKKTRTETILEKADGLGRSGIVDDACHAKVPLRRLGKPAGPAKAISGEEIRPASEEARPNQAVFARCLKVTPCYVSELERGTKPPPAAALALP